MVSRDIKKIFRNNIHIIIYNSVTGQTQYLVRHLIKKGLLNHPVINERPIS